MMREIFYCVRCKRMFNNIYTYIAQNKTEICVECEQKEQKEKI